MRWRSSRGRWRRTRWVMVALGVLALGIQFKRPDLSSPPIDRTRTLEARLEVPERVAGILDRACRDCHTSETRWPWYSHVAPVSWFVSGHVQHARSHLNFSRWAEYDTKRSSHLMEEVCEHASNGSMPLPSYTWIHRSARLAPDDVRELCEWSRSVVKMPHAQPMAPGAGASGG